MFDAAQHYGALAQARSRILAEMKLDPGGYVLVTVHRAENTDDPARFGAIRTALAEIARELPVIFPVHPRTRALLEPDDRSTRGLHVIDPVGYLDMLTLEKNAALIATDSGGVQKEAFFYGVPAVTLRDETEWVELIDLGWNRLAPPREPRQIVAILRDALRAGGGRAASPYGRGDAAQLVAARLAALSP
jgi:UDP-GlcNAc3NAcA epimerase